MRCPEGRDLVRPSPALATDLRLSGGRKWRLSGLSSSRLARVGLSLPSQTSAASAEFNRRPAGATDVTPKVWKKSGAAVCKVSEHPPLTAELSGARRAAAPAG